MMDDACLGTEAVTAYERGAFYIRPGGAWGRVYLGETAGIVSYRSGPNLERIHTMPAAHWDRWARDAVKRSEA